MTDVLFRLPVAANVLVVAERSSATTRDLLTVLDLSRQMFCCAVAQLFRNMFSNPDVADLCSDPTRRMFRGVAADL